jgi:putative protease
MFILAPVSSMEAAKVQIESGARELYVGVKSEVFNHYSFSGRGQVSVRNTSVAVNLNELKEIVKFAHDKNVKVNLTGNTPLFSDRQDGALETEYINEVLRAVDCSIDNIIIGDIGLLYRLSQMQLPVGIHASTYFDTYSTAQQALLADLGVKRIILTYQVSISEIQKICATGLTEVEVIGYLGCSFFNGACNFVHDMGGIVNNEGVNPGVSCKAKYRLLGIEDEEAHPFLDAEQVCAICAIPDLIDCNVTSIKIAGRDRAPESIAKVTRLYRNCIAIAEQTTKQDYIKIVKEQLPLWWNRLYCAHKRCKFCQSKITDSYIGI